MTQPLSRPATDSQYPVSPKGHPFRTVPGPLDSELQRRLDDIADKDVGVH